MCLNAQTYSDRWRLIMWLKGTAVASQPLTIHVLEMENTVGTECQFVPWICPHVISFTLSMCGKNLNSKKKEEEKKK